MNTSDNNSIWRFIFQLANVPVLSDAADTFFSSIVVLTPNGNFWVVPLLYSISDIWTELSVRWVTQDKNSQKCIVSQIGRH
jgi:hypothetical protein